MQRSAVIELNQRLINHVLADSTDAAPTTLIEPAAAFLDRGRWQRELLFLKSGG